MNPTFYIVEHIGIGFLAVMAKPAPSWLEDEISGLKRLQVNHVISLLQASEVYELGLEKEAALCEKHGMRFTGFPIADRGVPDSAGQFFQLASTIVTDCQRGENAVIHCRAGIGRTGMLAATVLLCVGRDLQSSFTQVSSARGVRVPDTEEQLRWVEHHAKELGKTPAI